MKNKLFLSFTLFWLINFVFANYLDCTTITPTNTVQCKAQSLINAHSTDIQNTILNSPVANGAEDIRSNIANLFAEDYQLSINTSISFTGTLGTPSSYKTYIITGASDCLGPPNKTSSTNPPATMPSMWIRDASAQLHSYLGIYQDTKHIYPQDEKDALSAIMVGFIHTAAIDIIKTPNAHAFDINGNVPSEGIGYEMDSNAFFIWFAYDLWKTTGQTAQFDSNFVAATRKIISLVGVNINSNINLSSTQLRASDDPAQYPYNIPDNMFMVTALNDLAQIFNDQSLNVYNQSYADAATNIAAQIQGGIEKHGITTVNGTTIYAYETDGVNYLTMDDANLPSLLSAPYLGYSGNSGTMRNTRNFALSTPADPNYFVSSVGGPPLPMLYKGIGSAHTSNSTINGIWPLSLISQGITESGLNNSADQQNVLEQLYSSAYNIPEGGFGCQSDTNAQMALYSSAGLLHESFSSVSLNNGTRGWFNWPNAFFAEWIDSLAQNSGTAPFPLSLPNN